MASTNADESAGSGADPVAFTKQLSVLAASAARLAALVEPLTPEELRQPAYPSQWSIADVLSHLGSGADITRGRLDGDVDMPAIWDEWNAKDPEAQAADSLRADRQLQERLERLTVDEQEHRRFAMGPMELDVRTFLGMRINEHTLHSWDIAVALDPGATIPADEAELVVDTLPMMTRFGGKPIEVDRTIALRTVGPTRHLALRPDGVALTPTAPAETPELELPADALIRLVYGRLDPAHTPPLDDAHVDLNELRRAFPGF